MRSGSTSGSPRTTVRVITRGALWAIAASTSSPSPSARPPGADAVRLIDVIWFERAGRAAAAFEVEHTTSIHSGIVRLLDLALGVEGSSVSALFIVAPDDREGEVRTQLRRPAFARVADLRVRYLPYGELSQHRASIARFGQGMRPIEALARELA